MEFSDALKHLKRGRRVTRASWPPGEFLYLVPGSTFEVNRAPLIGILGEGTKVNYAPHIDKCFGDDVCGYWTPSHADLLSDDWREAV